MCLVNFKTHVKKEEAINKIDHVKERIISQQDHNSKYRQKKNEKKTRGDKMKNGHQMNLS